MRNYILLLLLLYTFNLIAQCDNPQTITQGNQTFYGCITDSGEKNGDGTLTVKLENQIQIFKGVWEYGVFLSGKFSILTNEGDNIHTEEGVFNKSVVLKDGIMTKFDLKYQCGDSLFVLDNSIMETIIKNYEPQPSTYNYLNHYQESDIISDRDSTTVKLRSSESHRYLKMEINEEEFEWMFDTGGGDISIGYNAWQRILKQDQVDVLDLHIPQCGEAVGGHINFYETYKINNLKLGDFLLQNVIVRVAIDEGNNDSLLGLPFMSKFSDVKWSLVNNELVFIK